MQVVVVSTLGLALLGACLAQPFGGQSGGFFSQPLGAPYTRSYYDGNNGMIARSFAVPNGQGGSLSLLNQNPGSFNYMNLQLQQRRFNVPLGYNDRSRMQPIRQTAVGGNGVPLNGCGPGRQFCRSVKKCVSKAQLCNGVDDCGDGSDEENCRAPTNGCRDINGQLHPATSDYSSSYLGPGGCRCDCTLNGPQCDNNNCPGYTGCMSGGRYYERGQSWKCDCNTCWCGGFDRVASTLMGCGPFKTFPSAPQPLFAQQRTKG